VLFFMALVCLLLLQAPWASESTSESQNQTTPPLAELMFEGYGASFVLLSIVMGVAIIGGLFLAKEDPIEDERGPGKGDGDGGEVA
jgi:NADH:ubiquinone oxidoreductase subunit 6 (subunit J)